MGKVEISLSKKEIFGRNDYYPACKDSLFMLRIDKKRKVFTEEDVLEMKELGWKLEITTKKEKE